MFLYSQDGSLYATRQSLTCLVLPTFHEEDLSSLCLGGKPAISMFRGAGLHLLYFKWWTVSS